MYEQLLWIRVCVCAYIVYRFVVDRYESIEMQKKADQPTDRPSEQTRDNVQKSESARSQKMKRKYKAR